MKPTESPEPIDNSELLREIETIVGRQNGYGRVIVGEGRTKLTISVETRLASNLSPHEKAKQSSLPNKILIDQETVDMIAEITGSDEIKRIFVGSHPFWATVIRASLATDSSLATWRHGIQITSPTVDPSRKIAPCCLCQTVEEKIKRVKENKKNPVPKDQVETGGPPKGEENAPQAPDIRDFITQFQQRVAAESARAAARPRTAQIESKEELVNTDIVNAAEEVIRQGGKTRAERAKSGGGNFAYFVPKDKKLYRDLREWGEKAIKEATKKGQDGATKIIKQCIDGNGYWQTFGANIGTVEAVLAKIGMQLERQDETKKQYELSLAFGGNTDNRTGFWIGVR